MDMIERLLFAFIICMVGLVFYHLGYSKGFLHSTAKYKLLRSDIVEVDKSMKKLNQTIREVLND